ncbi:uncharacterized protein [Clytia hemisphaerica]
MYKGLREDKVRMALMNTDIAAYEQLEWNRGQVGFVHLAVVKTLPIEASIIMPGIGGLGDRPSSEAEVCLAQYRNTAVENAEKIFRRKIQVTEVYSESLYHLFSNVSVFSIMLILVMIMIAIGLSYDVYNYLCGQYKTRKFNLTDGREEEESENEELIVIRKKQWVELQNEITSLKNVVATKIDRDNLLDRKKRRTSLF